MVHLRQYKHFSCACRWSQWKHPSTVFSSSRTKWQFNVVRHNGSSVWQSNKLNTLRPRQDGRHFPDDIFKRIFFNENVWIPIEISLKFVPKGSINNIPSLVQIMAWRRPGAKPLSELMVVSLLTHICVTRPQWVKRDRERTCFSSPTWLLHWSGCSDGPQSANLEAILVRYKAQRYICDINANQGFQKQINMS